MNEYEREKKKGESEQKKMVIENYNLYCHRNTKRSNILQLNSFFFLIIYIYNQSIICNHLH